MWDNGAEFRNHWLNCWFKTWVTQWDHGAEAKPGRRATGAGRFELQRGALNFGRIWGEGNTGESTVTMKFITIKSGFEATVWYWPHQGWINDRSMWHMHLLISPLPALILETSTNCIDFAEAPTGYIFEWHILPDICQLRVSLGIPSRPSSFSS